MTRLKVTDIETIGTDLKKYDVQLMTQTGGTLADIAAHALGVEKKDVLETAKTTRAAVVPIESGLGIISGFSHVVAAILRHIGVDAFVTGAANVAGIAEGMEQQAGIIMMADDFRFVALNVKKGFIVDNSEATARGFVAALDLMVKGMTQGPVEQDVLILGCGPVGKHAAVEALRRKAKVALCDIVPDRSENLANEIKLAMEEENKMAIRVEKDPTEALGKYRYIIDATNAAAVITEDMVTPATYVSAPGMPLGITPEAVEKLGNRLFHDPLQTGVAVMAFDALS